jgi:hypothetical protein
VHDLGDLRARFSVSTATAIRIADDLPAACIKAGALFLLGIRGPGFGPSVCRRSRFSVGIPPELPAAA